MLSETIASIHWLSITIWQQKQTDIIPLVMDTLNLSAFKKRGNAAGRAYKQILFGEFDAKLYVHPYELLHGDHFHLELTGDACNAIEITRFADLFHKLTEQNYRFQVTRLDVALDTQRFDTSQIAQSVFVESKMRTRVHRENIRRTYNYTGTGDTIYFGSPESDTILRIYKKQVMDKIPKKVYDSLSVHERYLQESESGIDKYFKVHPIYKHHYFTRVELQLRDERANFLFKAFAYAPHTDWIILIGSSINDFVSIQTDYWQNWLEDCPSGALLAIQNPPKTIERTTKWLHHQVSASLVMYVQALAGNDLAARNKIVAELFDYGLDIMGDGHKQVIMEHRLAFAGSQSTFEFIGNALDESALEPAAGELDFRPLRRDYMDKIKAYPLWYRKFMLDNPLYESVRPSHFKFDARFGMVVLDLDSKEYHQAMDGLVKKEPAPAVPEQLKLLPNDTVPNGTNHYNT